MLFDPTGFGMFLLHMIRNDGQLKWYILVFFSNQVDMHLYMFHRNVGWFHFDIDQ